MEAIVQTGGLQYPVKKGQILDVNQIDAKEGTEIELDVLTLFGDEPKFGTPLVEGAKVKAKVLEHHLGDKIVVAKYKRRKGYHKKQGHRQNLTKIEIVAV